MAITLYDATVPGFLQILGALRGVLDKGLEHAKATGQDPNALVEARLIEDMFPLGLQVQRAAEHSAGALRDASLGAFTLPTNAALDYAGLQRCLAEAEAAVRGWTREAVNALEGRQVVLQAGSVEMTFAVEAFLLSMALPSFYFHAVTAYDILRMKGAPIGKLDYLAGMRATI